MAGLGEARHGEDWSGMGNSIVKIRTLRSELEKWRSVSPRTVEQFSATSTTPNCVEPLMSDLEESVSVDVGDRLRGLKTAFKLRLGKGS